MNISVTWCPECRGWKYEYTPVIETPEWDRVSDAGSTCTCPPEVNIEYKPSVNDELLQVYKEKIDSLEKVIKLQETIINTSQILNDLLKKEIEWLDTALGAGPEQKDE